MQGDGVEGRENPRQEDLRVFECLWRDQVDQERVHFGQDPGKGQREVRSRSQSSGSETVHGEHHLFFVRCWSWPRTRQLSIMLVTTEQAVRHPQCNSRLGNYSNV